MLALKIITYAILSLGTGAILTWLIMSIKEDKKDG